MFIVGILSWWYTTGFLQRVSRVRERLAGLLDYFSIGLLLSTLFAPFRQISAGRVSGSIAVMWRAFLDRLISRMIGGIVRSVMVIVGTAGIIISSIIGVFALLLWLAVPFLPIVGIILVIIGWVPTWK